MEGCTWAARSLWLTHTVKGVTCQEYTASYAHSAAPQYSQSSVGDSSRGPNDAAVEYYQRLYNHAEEQFRMRDGGNQPVYSNGQSYNDRVLQDAGSELGAARRGK